MTENEKKLLAEGLAAGLRTVSEGARTLAEHLGRYAQPGSEPGSEPGVLGGPRPRWMQWMTWELGQREVPGPEHNPRIVEYWRMAGLQAEPPRGDETPWCSVVLNAAMAVAGLPGTGSAMARSWMQWGEPLDEPRPGAVVVFWRGERDGRFGHCGLYVGEGAQGRVRVLGGNQRNALSIRSYPSYPLDGVGMGLLGYRWPKEEP